MKKFKDTGPTQRRIRYTGPVEERFIDTGPVEERFIDTGPVEKLVTPEMIIKGLSAEDTGITIENTGDPFTDFVKQKTIVENIRSKAQRPKR